MVTNPDEKWKWRRLWIKHCINKENDYLFTILGSTKAEKIDREKDVLEIIKNGFLTYQPNREPVESMGEEMGKAALNRYREAIEDWFLRRYNLQDAILTYLYGCKPGRQEKMMSWIINTFRMIFKLMFRLFSYPRKLAGKISQIIPEWFKTNRLLLFLKNILSLICVRYPVKVFRQLGITGILSLLVTGLTGLLIWQLWPYNTSSIFNSADNTIIKYVPVFLITIGIFLIVSQVRRFIFFRLLVTILVGFFPFVVEKDIWGAVHKLTELTGVFDPVLLFLLPVLAAIFYLTADCTRKFGVHWGKAMLRTAPITLYGLLFAITVGLFISDIMGESMMNGYPTAENYDFLFGKIYPSIIILFSSLALFVGIFIDSFFREESVTEPF